MYNYYEMAFFAVINGVKELYFPYRKFSEHAMVCYSELDGHSAATPEYLLEHKDSFLAIEGLTDEQHTFIDNYLETYLLTEMIIIDPIDLTDDYLTRGIVQD